MIWKWRIKLGIIDGKRMWGRSLGQLREKCLLSGLRRRKCDNKILINKENKRNLKGNSKNSLRRSKKRLIREKEEKAEEMNNNNSRHNLNSYYNKTEITLIQWWICLHIRFNKPRDCFQLMEMDMCILHPQHTLITEYYRSLLLILTGILQSHFQMREINIITHL